MKYAFFWILLLVTNIFMILVILVQRGRGGGLAGALGGMGGQSAFGAKAGDMFTKITIGVAIFWIALCALCLKVLSSPTNSPIGSMGTLPSAVEFDRPAPATGGGADDKSGESGEKPGDAASPPAGTSEAAEKPAGDAAAPAPPSSDSTPAPAETETKTPADSPPAPGPTK